MAQGALQYHSSQRHIPWLTASAELNRIRNESVTNTNEKSTRLMEDKRILTGSLSLILALTLCAATFGQPPQPESAPAESQFTTLRNQVTASSLTDEEKKPLLDALAKADAEAIETKQASEVTSKNAAAAAATTARSEKLNGELNSLSDYQPEPVAQDTLPELESALLAIESELTKARTAVTEAEAATAQSVQRRRQIETDVTALEKQLAERRAQLDSSLANPADSLPAAIQQAALQSSVKLLEASIESMKSELALIEARTNAGIYQLQRDVNARRVETIQQQQQLTAAAVEKTRSADASRRVAAAAELLTHLHPALVPIGEQNAKLAEQNKELAQKVDESRQLLARRSLRLEEIQTLYNQAKVRVETVGLTDAVGALLRNLKQALPSASAYRLRGRERQPEINDAQYALIELTDQRNVKLDIAVATLLRSTTPPIPFAERSQLETEARDLLEQQRSEYLDPAIRSQTTYFNTLVSLSTTEQQIVELVDNAVLYANERILWIRSSQPLHQRLIPAEDELWFRFGAVWERVPEKFYQQMLANPLVWTAAFLVLVLLLRIKVRLRQGIAAIGEKVKQSTFTRFTPTMESLGLTILAASPVTFVFGFIAWQIGPITGNDPALLAIVQSSIVIAAGFFPLEFLRQSCRSGGLGISHFEWPPNSAARLKRALWWVIATALPLIAITSFLNAGTLTFGNDTLERYFYLAAIVIVTLFAARMLNPKTGLPAAALRKRPTGWFSRTAFIWYPLSVAIPLTLGLLAIVGYYFTSQQLARKLFDTVCLTMTIVIAISLGLRWVVVNQRRVRIEEARKRREAAAKQTAGETPVAAPMDAAHALQTQMQQTRRVLNTVVLATSVIGAWIVWNDVFPALGFLENWPLWTSTTSVTESLPGISGKIATTTREIPDPVTITDLMFAGFLLGVTFIATGNLPGLLEFSLLRRLPLDSSVRYAITTLASYGIVLVGLIFAGQSVGLHWSQIQWMATALTFGLAFGLQEMFANFIAGIIILFEQPVRVGDVVEIDGVTGVVSQIRIRATTITNWDRMDYIVPNKEFITGKLLNWTRSDNITRITVDIGVAYGSDTERVRELLMQVATEHPEVMDDPAVMAVFHGFGDNSLSFSLRSYVNNPDHRLSVIHDIHTKINKVFHAEGIEISFPQRDLHLRSVPEDFERMFRSRQTSNNTDNDGGGASTTNV